jgi:hypothetical protein
MTMPILSLVESGPDDQRLVQYLLDLLPPEQTEILDEASIVHDDVAARLHVVEQDLVDSYVRGTLTGETLKRFESHYLASPRRRELVAFARRFAPAVDRAAVADGLTSRQGWRRASLVRRFGAAAALLLVMCGALLLLTVRPGKRVGVAPTERAASTDALDTHLAPGAPAPAPAASAGPPILARLSPQTRSIGEVSAVAIPQGVDHVGFELRLESDDSPRYQVGLRDPATNRIVWRSSWIAATSRAGQPSVLVAVPTGLLKPQHYSFDLTGRRTGADSELAGSYVFEIAPR